jgi:hypothetical protein
MSFYVKRERDGRTGWTGPIRSELQAGREAEAWRLVNWTADVVQSTPEVRKQIREWERKVRIIETY